MARQLTWRFPSAATRRSISAKIEAPGLLLAQEIGSLPPKESALFQTGSDKWVQILWPPRTAVARELYFKKTAAADPPKSATQQSFDSYVSDRASRPLPPSSHDMTHRGPSRRLASGRRDQRFVDHRPDV
jgi:hypothetical protein